MIRVKSTITPTIFLMILIGFSAVLSGCATPYTASVDERDMDTLYNDEKITFKIKQAFLEDDSVKYMDYDAASYEGHAYIVGEYTSKTQADRAVSLTRAVEGVKQVTTYLAPKRELPDCGTTDNLELMASIKQKLIKDEDIWSTNVDVYMVQCHAVILGIVGSETERTKAMRHINSVKGLKGVTSYLKVKQ